MTLSSPGLLCWDLLNTDSVSLLLISLFRFSIYLWFNLGKFCVSRNLFIKAMQFFHKISWNFFIKLHEVFLSYNSCFCRMVVISLLIFDSNNLNSLFFLVNLSKNLSTFWTFKRISLWFHWFFCCLSCSILRISSLILSFR